MHAREREAARHGTSDGGAILRNKRAIAGSGRALGVANAAPRSAVDTAAPSAGSPGHSLRRTRIRARIDGTGDGLQVVRDENQDPAPSGGSRTPTTGQGGAAIPTGIELAGNDRNSYSTLPSASQARYRTYIQNQTLMRLLPTGDYRHGCVKEFLTTASTTCPTSGLWAERNGCSGDKCLRPAQYGRLGTQTDGPDTFFDNHRTRHPDSILEGTGLNACSEVCHQRYKFRADSNPGTYRDLGSFYIIRNFRADTVTDGEGNRVHVTTGSINKVPAQRSAPSREEFARTIAPRLARGGTLAVPPPQPRPVRRPKP